MRTIKEISGINIQFPLGMHIDMQLQLYGLIQPIAPEKILLEASDVLNWKTDLDQEKDSVRETVSSKETDALVEKDHQRDQVIIALFHEIRLADKSPIQARQKIGHRLRIVIDPYKGLQNERMPDKTGHIIGLLNDLDKTDVAADVTALGVAELVSMLRTNNNEFIALRDARLKGDAAIHLSSGTALRKKNDSTVSMIFRHIEAAYLTTASDEDRKLISELIDRINKVLQNAKSSYRQSIALKRLAAEKRGEKEPKEPKQPQQPKDPKQPKEPKDPKEPQQPKEPKDPKQPKQPDPKPTPDPKPKPKPGEGDDDGDDVYIPSE